MRLFQPVKLCLLAILVSVCVTQGGWNQPEAQVSLRSEELSFAAVQWPLKNEPATSAHLDGDQILDRVVGHIEGSGFRTEVFLSSSQSSIWLDNPLIFPVAEIKVYDIDHDNDNDLVVQEFGAPGILNVWLGDGQGHFVRSVCFLKSLPSEPETQLTGGHLVAAALVPNVWLAFEKTASGFAFAIAAPRDTLDDERDPLFSSADRFPSISRGPPVRLV